MTHETLELKKKNEELGKSEERIKEENVKMKRMNEEETKR